jgi:hypothetical protein
VHFLGEKGYRELAKKIIRAESRIIKGFADSGYKTLGEPSVIATFTSEGVNLFRLSDEMAKKGLGNTAQKGIQNMKIPPSLHLTITPIHDEAVDTMIEDLKACTEAVKKMPPSETEGVLETFELIFGMLAPGEMDVAVMGKLFFRDGKGNGSVRAEDHAGSRARGRIPEGDGNDLPAPRILAARSCGAAIELHSHRDVPQGA